ncbi:ISH3 family transposase, partial [Halococcus salsus]|uniref:ISH3 family transposase n=1 Tax=Halococcus salsus TaxID=2162894 RepID=UPI001F037667
MFDPTQPDDRLSATDAKELAHDQISDLPLPGIEGSPLDPGDIWPVVARAAVGQTSVWEICSQTDETPCDDAVREWLHTVDQDDIEAAANELLADQATEVLDLSRSRTVLLDFVDNPYHGTFDDEEGELCRMKATDGTTTCHRYCTAFTLTTGKRLTLALTKVRSDEPTADAVERVLDHVGSFPFETDVYLADRGFYIERVLRSARQQAPVVVPVVPKGDRLKQKLETSVSKWDSYTMYKGRKRELTFPLAVCISYQNGDRGKSGEVVRGYAACGLTDRRPKQIEQLYRKRSAIETGYRLFRQARAVTTTQDVAVRVLYVVVSFLLKNLWVVLRWAVVARPRRGGRDLPNRFTFNTFCEWTK